MAPLGCLFLTSKESKGDCFLNARLLKRVDSPGEGGGAVTKASESTWDACVH